MPWAHPTPPGPDGTTRPRAGSGSVQVGLVGDVPAGAEADELPLADHVPVRPARTDGPRLRVVLRLRTVALGDLPRARVREVGQTEATVGLVVHVRVLDADHVADAAAVLPGPHRGRLAALNVLFGDGRLDEDVGDLD